MTVFKRLWPEVAPYKFKLLGVLLIGAAVSGLKSITPELTRRLANAWEQGDHSLTFQIPLAIAGIYILASAGRFVHLFWMKYTSELIAVKQRRDLMNKYLTLNLSFFQNFERGSGGLISRMINDIQVVQGGIHKVADMLREPFMAVFIFGYLFYIDWKLTLFVLTALPLIVVILRNLARSLRKYGHRNQESMEDLTRTLKESLDGTRVVQSFNLQEEMRNRFDREANKFLQTRKKIIGREEAAPPISESLAALATSALLIYIGLQIQEGALQIGDFLGFILAVGLLQDSIRKIQGGYVRIQQASVALERLHSILESKSMVPEVAEPKPFPKNWREIRFENVCFHYGETRILNKINLTVHRGEIIALVGASGSGKSTMVNLLERFFDPSEGRITIGGVDIKELDLNELRSNIALVTQDVFLFSESIERNIQAGDFSKTAETVPKAAQMANAHNFIKNTEEGYKSRVGDHGNRLSGGEKQRISIARAIFKDAPLLILDEATSALDSISEQEVQKGLDQLLRGRTAFVIAHRLSTVNKADRILVMREGAIIEQGSHQELLSHEGEYYRFHSLQR